MEKEWDSGIKLTIEITNFKTLCLFVDFLVANGFKVKSKDDPTLARPGSQPEEKKTEAPAQPK